MTARTLCVWLNIWFRHLGGLLVLTLMLVLLVEAGRHGHWLGSDNGFAASAPSFVWLLFMGVLWCCFFPRNVQQRWPSGWIALLLVGLTAEVLQAYGWPASATFDPLDLLALLLAYMTLLAARSLGWMASAPPFPFDTRLAVLPVSLLALGSQLACTLDDNPCNSDDSSQCSTAIVLTREEWRVAIEPEYGNNATLQISGKIYQLEHWLAVIDSYRGIHIFDVSDNQNPMRQVYLPIAGVTDVSIKDDVLYANAFTDLVAIDLEALESGTFTSAGVIRNLDVFRFITPDSFWQNAWFSAADERIAKGYDTDKILIGYIDPDGHTWLYGEQVEEQP
jgi:hypothetical protein